MNRSYSKIRHIQESNLMLENRRIKEKSRQLLMEEDKKIADFATLFVTEFNRVMEAYKIGNTNKTTYTAKYNKGIDDYHGTISILEDGKEKVTSSDFGEALTKKLQTVGGPAPTAAETDLDYKINNFTLNFKTRLNDVFTDDTVKGHLKAAINSGMRIVKDAYLKPTQNPK